MKIIKRITTGIIAITMAVMFMLSAVMIETFAVSKYGEDQPLTCIKKDKIIISSVGHVHEYIKASNGCRYIMYHSCMDDMVGSSVTNHSDYVTIDGVKYSLCNYGKKGQETSFASVIKKVEGAATTSDPETNLNNSASSDNTTSNNTNKNDTINSSQSTGAETIKTIELQKISLNYTSLNFTPNQSDGKKLTVSFTPSNTTVNKKVSWKSSNTTVAVVSSNGTVSSKKAGTATITATCNGKTATCKVSVKEQEKYLNVNEAYSLLNKFRTTKSNQWYWKSNNKSKTYVYGLKELKKDATLEKIAKQRAKEQWTQYYVNGKATHDRPNGKNCWTAYTTGANPCGENLAWGQRTCAEVVTEPYRGWAETYEKYANQGHRRNMLNPDATRVGIACFEKNGKTCWAMCLGY